MVQAGALSPMPCWQRPATILVAALLLRLVTLLPALHSPTFSDESDYHQLATSLAQGHGFRWLPERAGEVGRITAWRPPAWPFVQSLVYRVTGPSPAAARVVQALLGTLLVGVVLLLAGVVLPDRRRAMALAGWWATLSPALLYYSHTLFGETLFALLIGLVLWLLLRPAATGRHVFVAGLLLGVACLTRSATLLFVLLLLPWLGWRVSWRAAAALLLGVALTVGPWTARNYAVFGVFAPVDLNGGMNLYWGNHPTASMQRAWDIVDRTEKPWPRGNPPDEVLDQQLGMRGAIGYIEQRPGRFLVGFVLKNGNLWGLERGLASGVKSGLYQRRGVLVYAAAAWGMVDTWLLFVLAVWGALAYAPRAPVEVQLLLMASLSVAHGATYGHSRYRFGALPLLLVLAAAALAEWPRWRDTWAALSPRRRRWGLALALLISLNLAYEVVFLELLRR